MSTSKRERIMEEMHRRIALAFPTSLIERGFQEEAVTTFNHFYMLDMPEALSWPDPNRRGMYEVVLPVSVSYWVQADPKEIYKIGNELLEKIRLAVELDENFSGMVLSYHMDEGALIWYDEGVLDVELMFSFEYTKDAGWARKPFKQ